ncbi:DUF3421 domain-containing protein [Caerostris darwini]|uniref:DUF3421 domain-containing protein n=1 Tax=Caerostris darwini TaxID=1538125 RepID=A0AAV4PK33_9ARAC|nr:DUF3421 domain-containing protein [Caerostris darwini]
MADTNRYPFEPPFSPPDCPFVKMSPGSELPEELCDLEGKLHGDKVYIGRVFDEDCYLVGTAIPSKGKCIYLSKKLEIKSTDTYDIITVSCGNPLEFRHMDFNSRLLFVSGGDEDNCLYCSRVVDGENTYYGWVDEETKTAYIPRELSAGPNKLTEGYDVLLHKYLDRLCICPPAPTPPF